MVGNQFSNLWNLFEPIIFRLGWSKNEGKEEEALPQRRSISVMTKGGGSGGGGGRMRRRKRRRMRMSWMSKRRNGRRSLGRFCVRFRFAIMTILPFCDAKKKNIQDWYIWIIDLWRKVRKPFKENPQKKKCNFLFLFVCVNILQGGRNTRNRALVPVYGNLKFYFIQLGPATHTTIYIRRKKNNFLKLAFLLRYRTRYIEKIDIIISVFSLD